MKKLKKISLHSIGQAELAKKEQSLLKGGGTCTCTATCGANCPCRYAGEQNGSHDSFYGGSSTFDNRSANGMQSFDNNIGSAVDSMMR